MRNPAPEQRLVRPDEGRPVLRAALTGFLVFFGYGLLKPVRDEVGTHYTGEFSDLWTRTFLLALIATPLYGWLAARTPRRALVPRVYVFFGLSFLLFRMIGADSAFYVWLSIYNLFVLSLVWSQSAEAFRSEQGKRVFGLLAAGVSLGLVCGNSVTAFLVRPLGVDGLLLLSALTMFGAAASAHGILPPSPPAAGKSDRIGGAWWTGLANLFRDPYLLAVTAYLVLYLVGNGFIYLLKNALVEESFADSDDRRSFFARVDLIQNSLTLLLQIFVTGRWMPRFGVALTLAAVPLVTLAGFGLFAALPLLLVIVVFEVARRVTEFALSKPAREVLFTVGGRGARFQSKPVLDTAIYRGADVGVAKGYEALAAAGLEARGLALAVLPFAACGLALSALLGRMHESRARAADAATIRA